MKTKNILQGYTLEKGYLIVYFRMVRANFTIFYKIYNEYFLAENTW